MQHYSNRRYRDLRIVGTHHSACYEIDGRDTLKSSFSKVSFLAKTIPGVSSIFSSWSRCQKRNIDTQLRMGVRYFDIRLAYAYKSIHVSHSCRGPELKNVLNDFVKFYADGSRNSEVIVIRFRPDVGNKKTMVSDEAKKAFRDIIQNHEISKYINTIENPFEKPLSALSKKPIVVIYNHGLEAKFMGFGHHVPRYFNHWLRTNQIPILHERMIEAIETVSKEQKHFPLTVCQNILTPNANTIILSVLYRTLLCVILPVFVLIYVVLWITSTDKCKSSVMPHLMIGSPTLILILLRILFSPRWSLLDETSKLVSRSFVNKFCHPSANSDFNVITVDNVQSEFCLKVIRLNEDVDSSSKELSKESDNNGNNSVTAADAIGVGVVTPSLRSTNVSSNAASVTPTTMHTSITNTSTITP